MAIVVLIQLERHIVGSIKIQHLSYLVRLYFHSYKLV